MTATQTATASTQPPPPIRKRRAKSRIPRRVTDRSGAALVHVPLKHGAVAILDASDFARLMGLGISDQWSGMSDGHGHSYAGVWDGSTMIMVARLIVDAPRGQVVRFLDHNPMNLRRSNLAFGKGFSKQREADIKAGPVSTQF